MAKNKRSFSMKAELDCETDVVSTRKRKRNEKPVYVIDSSESEADNDVEPQALGRIQKPAKIKTEAKTGMDVNFKNKKSSIIKTERHCETGVKSAKKKKRSDNSVIIIESSESEVDGDVKPQILGKTQEPPEIKTEPKIAAVENSLGKKKTTGTLSIKSESEASIDMKPSRKRKSVPKESSPDDDCSASEDEWAPSPPTKKVKKSAAAKTIRAKKEPKPSTSKQTQKSNYQNVADEFSHGSTQEDKSINQRKNAAPKQNYQSCATYWDPAEEIAAQLNLDLDVSHSITRLFDDGNTIPFLARYRRNLIGNCDAEKLRSIKTLHEYLKQVQTRAVTVVKQIQKTKELPPEVERTILNARSLEEVDFLYSPYKTEGKGTKAEKARKLGLEPLAMSVLNRSHSIDYECLKNYIKPELPNVDKVMEGVQHIIAEVISKDKLVLEELKTLLEQSRISIETKETKKPTKEKEKKEDFKEKDRHKYQNFFDFRNDVNYLKPHQVLAINRGESQKFLSVKIILPDDFISDKLYRVCEKQWLQNSYGDSLKKKFIDASLKDAYNRLIAPYIKRQVRSRLNLKATEAAVEVFTANLKNLLLMPPLRGKCILAIDPGFTHGCKFAVIDSIGTVLHTETMYLSNNTGKHSLKESDARRLRDLLVKFNCDTVAIGNGKGCREIEAFLGARIQEGFFSPDLDVSYTIVSEQGASIYSVSEEAKKEFPNTDPNLVSAVSIARRLQDPLSELVKIEPKHLGVGMYQLDMNDKLLESALNEIVIECVSFVGVDINTASIAVLRKLSGLNQAKANDILEWRKKNGVFTNRVLLKSVKGIGEKTFEQCAGFIRIMPQTANAERPDSVGGKKKLKISDAEFNPLDQTWIHPESYPAVNKFCTKFNLDLNDLGSDSFVKSVNEAVSTINIQISAKEFGLDVKTFELIISALTKPLNHDFRDDFSKPLFKKGLISLADITPGETLTGRVSNVTSFGAFVDIGVTVDGLIHVSNYRGLKPKLGDRVEVKVENIDVARKRISLILVKIT